MRDYQHIRICCSATCARLEMKKLAQAMAINPIKMELPDFTVSIPGYRWRFLFDTPPERIYGTIVDSWDCCDNENMKINPAIIEYLKTHLGREKF